MPFKSKAQRRLFWAKQNRGEIAKSTVEDWEHATRNKSKLPEHVKKAGHQHALHVLGLLALSLLSSCAFTESSAGKETLGFLLQTLVLILTPVVLLLVKKLVTAIEKKTGLDVSTRQIELLNQAITDGIALAQEQAHKRLKLDEPPLTSDGKLDIAVKFVVEALRQSNGPQIARDYIIKLIEARLNMSRALPPKATP